MKRTAASSSEAFYGKKTFSPFLATDTYTLTVINNGGQTTAFAIRGCKTSCPSYPGCSYISGVGYCNAKGACINGGCICDNSTLLLSSSCVEVDTDLWTKLFGLWIACIVIGFLLVCVLPVVVCCCCCGLCAAAVTSQETQHIHHHHHQSHHQSHHQPVNYQTVLVPTPGVPYVQAQPGPQNAYYAQV